MSFCFSKGGRYIFTDEHISKQKGRVLISKYFLWWINLLNGSYICAYWFLSLIVRECWYLHILCDDTKKRRIATWICMLFFQLVSSLFWTLWIYLCWTNQVTRSEILGQFVCYWWIGVQIHECFVIKKRERLLILVLMMMMNAKHPWKGTKLHTCW